jgi:hypothetical protein
MTDGAYESDLVVLTADKNKKFAVQGLLNRPQALRIRPLSAVFYIHPESDPGCLLHAALLLHLWTPGGTRQHRPLHGWRLSKTEIETSILISGFRIAWAFRSNTSAWPSARCMGLTIYMHSPCSPKPNELQLSIIYYNLPKVVQVWRVIR